jgi:hypothetical protein
MPSRHASPGRFGTLRSSTGYETEGREKYDHKVTFNFDYSDVSVSVEKARRLIEAFGKELKTDMKGVKSSNGFIFADSDFRNYSTATINLMSDKALARDMYSLGKETSAEAKAVMKKYIGSRVDTGRMKGSVYGSTVQHRGRVVAEAGWLDLWYRYFGYQEEGTRYVSPMHSVLRTYLEVAPQVQKSISWYIRNFTKGKGIK